MAKGLHDGTVKPEDLSKEYILNTYKELYKGANEGYSEKFTSFTTEPDESRTIQALKQNIYMFSQAKNFGLFIHMQGLLEKNGKIQSFNDFKKDVLKLNPTYNKNYLQAEFQTARATANHVRNWQQFEANKALFPNLRYKTVGDARVREQHELLNNHVAAVDDAFWLTYYPPNGWRCRCFVEQTNEATSDKKITVNEAAKFGVPEAFKMNAAKEQQIFDKQKNPFFALTNNTANKKVVEQTMERNKLDAPLELAHTASNGAKVKISPFADTNGFSDNLRIAIKVADTIGLDLDMIAHLKGRVIIGEKQPEYRNGENRGDLKTPSSTSLRKRLKSASDQKVEFVIFDLSKNQLTIEQAITEIKQRINKKQTNEVYPTIKRFIIVSRDGNNVELFKREDLIEK
ncbi:MAG: phage minor head protein [Vicingaceae bacterium]|nr:phage minor head protein [Vicingaceae bacterium]